MDAYEFFENGQKNMSFMIEYNSVLIEYYQICHKIKKTWNIEFHSKPANDEKYIKAKVKEFNGVVNINFLGKEIPKEGMHYTCVACKSIDSFWKWKKELFTSLFKRV